MRVKLIKACWVIYAALIVLFLFSLTPFRDYFSGNFELFPGIPLIGLGVLLVILTAATRSNRVLKVFLTITGVSAAGWPCSLFLHGYFYQYYPTEPVTYILFFLVFPLALAIGGTGSLVAGLILSSQYKE